MRWKHLLTLVVLAFGLSCSPVGTAVDIEFHYEESWALESFHLSFAGHEREMAPAKHLRVLLANDLANTLQSLVVEGWRADARFAVGQIEILPKRNQIVTVSITLARVPCGAWCTPGTMQCDGDGVVVCEEREDGCAEWSEPTTCGDEAPSCSLGVCRTHCIDECAEGETRCDGPDGVRSCGQDDSDSCFDWLPVQPCLDEASCSAGSCRQNCQDACPVGAAACVADGTSLCGDLDDNGCTEWGPMVSCATGENCSEGVCQEGACVDDCSESSCADLTFSMCGQFDSDSCLDLSPGTSCVPEDPCNDGLCTSLGCEATPMTCDAPPESICLDSNTLQVSDAMGQCTTGDCDYNTREVECANCPACDACSGVSCSDIPEPICLGSDILRTYAFGSCSEGACDYPYADETCSCFGGACESCGPLVCSVEVMANPGGYISGLAVDETHLYLGMHNGIFKRAKSGGDLETIQTTSTPVGSPVTDQTHVYWVKEYLNIGHFLERRLKSGGPIESIDSSDAIRDVALDQTHVYWIEGYRIRRRLKSGGPVETILSISGFGQSIVVDDTHLYFTQTQSDGGYVGRIAKNGTGTAQGVESPDPYEIAQNATHAFFTDSADDVIRSIRKSDGIVETFASSQDRPSLIVADETHVYWAPIFDSGTIMRRAASGGPVESVVYMADDDSKFIKLDATSVYWGTYDGVLGHSKCPCEP